MDLGLGYDTFDACIIVTDVCLHQLLNRKEGNYIIDDHECLKEIIKFSPIRLFRTKYASIMVNQKIPTKSEKINGPHTHLLPQIILQNVNFPMPISDDMCLQIQVDPFGSVIDGDGGYADWQGFENDKFQFLLKEYGDYVYMENKFIMRNIVSCHLKNNDLESIAIISINSNMKDLLRIVLAQIVCDVDCDSNLRRRGIAALEKIKAINLHVLKKWVTNKSPELLQSECKDIV